MAEKKRYWCPSCGCVREFWSAPLVDCRHNVSDSAVAPRPFELIPASHPLADLSTELPK
jgi:hypothetical protein